MPSEIHKLSFLHILESIVLVIASLYWASAVFIPLALALMLTFLLQPVVAALHRRGLGYAPAAVLVVTLLALAIGAIGWVAVTQLSSLASELPRYQDNLRQKLDDFQHASQGSIFGKIQQAVAELSRKVERPQLPATAPQEPITVTPPWPALVSYVVSYVPSFLGFLVHAALVLVLLLFMLIAHRDLRDRLFRLVGYGRVTVTTKALEEAGQRISRSLIMQAIVNGTYGSGVGLGLFCLGVPYALMWGLFAAMLRFIPYIGPAVGALMPIALSMAVFVGWVKPLLVGGLFVLLEIATNALLEPLLYSRGAGVSQVAILMSIVFWAWLWGPVGLLLATPLTVCLGVLGKYVPYLTFLEVLLSDEPVTDMNRYYQRLVARDQDGAIEIVEELLETRTLLEVYEDVVIPALYYAKQDQRRDNLTADEAHAIYRATHELIDDLSVSQAASSVEEAVASVPEEDTAAVRPPHIRILGCPAYDKADEVALRMLQQVLDPRRFDVEVTKAGLLAGEVLSLVEQSTPTLVCIGLVPPGGFAQTRYLCKKLRVRFPTLPIVVGCWSGTNYETEYLVRLRLDSLTQVSTTLTKTHQQIMQLPPIHVPPVAHTVSSVA
jgi:predicted PurR-regulated permease PerM